MQYWNHSKLVLLFIMDILAVLLVHIYFLTVHYNLRRLFDAWYTSLRDVSTIFVLDLGLVAFGTIPGFCPWFGTVIFVEFWSRDGIKSYGLTVGHILVCT